MAVAGHRAGGVSLLLTSLAFVASLATGGCTVDDDSIEGKPCKTTADDCIKGYACRCKPDGCFCEKDDSKSSSALLQLDHRPSAGGGSPTSTQRVEVLHERKQRDLRSQVDPSVRFLRRLGLQITE